MKRKIRAATLLVATGIIAGWFLTSPQTLSESDLAGLEGDAKRGARVFALGGCASCHAAPDVKGDAMRALAGGRGFLSPFGTFYAPNISPDMVHGIGGWSVRDLVNAMKFGTSPDGQHYFPAFPYTSYARADVLDIVDLKAFLDTLPAADAANKPHDVPFPFNFRPALGGWKLLFSRDVAVIDTPLMSEAALRGRILVEGLGHCGECHTPRGAFGNLQYQAWLQGAPNPTGNGKIPSLAPGENGLDWSLEDIAEYLKSGFTPEFDTAGGAMVEVIENTSQLSDQDRLDIAAYLKALPGG